MGVIIMSNISTNLYIFVIVTATLAFELLITKLANVSVTLLWGFTLGIYFIFLLYQVIIKINEDTEKKRVKDLLFELMDTISGLPVMNKNERLIIKWDIVFKKLVDFKEFELYDKIIKAKTTHIDGYVNKYPSLLVDDTIDLKESKYNGDLNSTIRNKRKRDDKADAELVQDEECKKKLFIRDIKDNTAAFSNYNSTLYVDVILKNEYVPENADVMGIEHDSKYDGFSVWMVFDNNKYNVVPRIMMHNKLINKSKWFIDNIGELLKCAAGIVSGESNQILYVDNYKLMGYLIDMPDENEQTSILKFKQLVNEVLIFVGTDENNRTTTAYCEFKPGYNRFEVILKSVEIKDQEKVQNREIDKTVAIGSGYQPLVILLEKMPELIKNIDLVVNNKDISSIVIR
ncbi:MAG: hypothetical protein K0S61_1873 [Anaerocolumna sp.]|jgi:hypothetical protein|nr:hypothetical protein [Anaerocolumna sp.]